jgi:hypothetical protein
MPLIVSGGFSEIDLHIDLICRISRSIGLADRQDVTGSHADRKAPMTSVGRHDAERDVGRLTDRDYRGLVDIRPTRCIRTFMRAS